MKKNRIIFLSFFLWLGIPVALAQFEPAPVTLSSVTETLDGKTYYIHTIEPDQTLFSIARAYQVTPRAISDANPEYPDLLEVVRSGQKIRIPVSAGVSAPSPLTTTIPAPAAQPPSGRPQVMHANLEFTEFIEHQVARRETLYGISRQYGISQEEILKNNPEARSGLRFRQVLRIPRTVSRPVEFFLYTVKAGDTKFGLAQKFMIPQENLEMLNPEIVELGLVAGQSIRIPAEALPEPDILPPPEAGLVFVPDTIPGETTVYDDYCLDPELKTGYNVALLIPLFLNQFEGNTHSMPADHISFTFIQFYQGIIIALDSIQKLGYHLALQVHDVGRDQEPLKELLREPGFSNLDLIIGPFYPENVDLVARFGLQHGIPVVSPLLNNSAQLKGFPNLFQVSPSMETQLSALAGYLAKAYPDENIILVHNDQPQAKELISVFRDALRIEFSDMSRPVDTLSLSRVDGYYFSETFVGKRRTNVLVMNDSLFLQNQTRLRRSQTPPREFKEIIYNRDHLQGLIRSFDKEKKNIVITLIGGEAFLSNYLRELNQLTNQYDLTLFGTPQWTDYQTIDPQYLQNLKVHIFTPDFVEYRDQHIRDFVYRYRQIFRTEPTVDAFKGVQTGFFFFNALLHYGKQFPRCIPHINRYNPQCPFVFERLQSENDGWENLKFTLYRHREFRREDVTRPFSDQPEY